MAKLQMDDKWCMNLVIREWSQNLNPLFEFRCFVSNEKLTAVTQYNQGVFVPELCKNKKKIQTAIKQFVHQIVIPRVPLPFYTVDVGVDLASFDVCLIELNGPVCFYFLIFNISLLLLAAHYLTGRIQKKIKK